MLRKICQLFGVIILICSLVGGVIAADKLNPPWDKVKELALAKGTTNQGCQVYKMNGADLIVAFVYCAIDDSTAIIMQDRDGVTGLGVYRDKGKPITVTINVRTGQSAIINDAVGMEMAFGIFRLLVTQKLL